MRSSFPKVYQSFGEFERDELKKLDGLGGTVDRMLDDLILEFSSSVDEPADLDFDEK